MMTSKIVRAHTQVAVPDPRRALDVLSAFYRDNDCSVSIEGDDHVISISLGTVRVGPRDRAIGIEITAANDTAITQLKTGVITMVDQLVPGADLDCRWHGAGQASEKGGKLPNFRELSVGKVTNLGPDMRRLRLYGDDLTPYLGGAIHVRLIIPPHGVSAPQWPTMGENGLPVWPKGEDKVEPRVYTIRQINADEGWMDIDFVVHGDNGPGSRFANNAVPGQLVGVTGPIGSDLPVVDWYLFAADETGIPAICRYLEDLPDDKTGHVILEVSGPDAKQNLPHHPGFDLAWIFRDGSCPEMAFAPQGTNTNVDADADAGAGAGAGDDVSPFARAICDIKVPDETHGVFCWTATEQKIYRHLHTHFRKTLKLGREQCLVMTFWRAEAH
ncbi:siderophore-interacting protein [Thalassospira sp. MCCC 1A01428]|uniref:siderophore-interacting protein n=1 Tax=Thalassospira sp. MCCC 1A01428 TaxID=1470575 RepID=UPI00111C3A61|nr:siderophore-interacting protein [Thalassospira sp. MCCC 1A01428]